MVKLYLFLFVLSLCILLLKSSEHWSSIWMWIKKYIFKAIGISLFILCCVALISFVGV